MRSSVRSLWPLTVSLNAPHHSVRIIALMSPIGYSFSWQNHRDLSCGSSRPGTPSGCHLRAPSCSGSLDQHFSPDSAGVVSTLLVIRSACGGDGARGGLAALILPWLQRSGVAGREVAHLTVTAAATNGV